MLRVYALPAVEAATPETPNPTSPQSSVDDLSVHPALTEAASPAPAAIAPPEAPTVLEFSAPQPPAVPAQAVANPTSSSPTSSSPASDGPILSSPASDGPASDGPASSAPEATGTKPAESSQPEAGASSAKPPAPTSDHPNRPKAEAGRAPTVAGMRQLLEKRLGEIVTQDKATRTAQWQQNLLYTALQYAWAGRFEEARQIASHPALPAGIKTELLGKILAIELQRQTNPVAVVQQPSAKPGTPTAAQPSGRVVPSGYASTGVGTSWASSGVVYPGLPGGQCPAVPATKLLASKSVSLGQPAQAASAANKAATSQFPAFVPILAQNLASRMVHQSRQSVVPTSGKPSQPYAPAISLIGVASGSFKQAAPKPTVQAKASPSQAKPALPATLPKSAAGPQKVQATTQAQPRSAQTQIIRPIQTPALRTQALQTQPIQTPLPQPPRISTAPSASPLAPAHLGSQSGRPTPTAGLTAAIFPSPDLLPSPDLKLPSAVPARTTTLPKAEPLNVLSDPEDGTLSGDWHLNPVSTTVNRSLEQFESILPDWIPNPLNFAWMWWAEAEQTGIKDGQDQASSNFLSPVPLQPTQLAQSPLLQPLEANWSKVPMQLEFGRSARKVSLPIAAKPTAAAPTTDLAELVALSCANAQLADRLNSYVIDPAVSKQLGWVNLMFPLPIASVITSAFGWRIHPISGNLSFHSGLDLGAPTGTPVLAALPGRVVGSDYMGGYGLAVIVETSNQQRNLYAHLSGIAVQPGMQVNQGTVLGWVGSTGNSTGPHLHFETLVETKDGWTAIDPLVSAGGSR